MSKNIFDVTINMNSIDSILKDRGLQDYGPVQKFLDKRIIEQAKPYTPKDNNILYSSALYSTDFGSGVVIYNTPYAHYQYEGILYVDPKTGKGAYYSPDYGFWSRKGVQKIPSTQELTYHGGGKRGKKWVERMWVDKETEIIAEVQSIVDRRGK